MLSLDRKAMETEKQFLGTISILLKARERKSETINKILTDASHIVLARSGINIEPRCAKNCLGVITVFARGSKEQIKELESKLAAVENCEVRSCVFESIYT